MTEQAQSAKVIEITLAPTLHYGNNMICVPETLPEAFGKTPMDHEFGPLFAARVAQTPEFLHSIDAAPCAYPLIAEKNLLAQIGRLRP